MPRKFRKAFERPQYSAAETELLSRLIEEGHTPQSCAIVLGRSVRGVTDKAKRAGRSFGKGIGSNGVLVRFSLEREAFATLRSVANEIQIHPNRLARICITIIARENKWRELLRLSDDDGDYLAG